MQINSLQEEVCLRAVQKLLKVLSFWCLFYLSSMLVSSIHAERQMQMQEDFVFISWNNILVNLANW